MALFKLIKDRLLLAKKKITHDQNSFRVCSIALHSPLLPMPSLLQGYFGVTNN